MKIQAKAAGSAPFQCSTGKGFYTEADLRTIVQQAVQEVVMALMVDEDEGSNSENAKAATGERLTMSVQEAAEFIGISKPKMFELLNSGEIRCKRIGRKILISRQVLVDWINQ